MVPPQTYRVRLLEKKKVSQDAYSFYFERPEDFDFTPGQYIKMTLDIAQPDERGASHFFSIASSPTEKDHILITTRILMSTFKKKLQSIENGEEVQIRGPHGNFVLDYENQQPKVFLTGGIGITPFRSMFVFARDKNLKSPVTLLASFSSEGDLLYYEELKGIAGENLKFIVTITKEAQGWTGEKGRIDGEKIKRYIENVKNSIYYIAGPEPMVNAMKELVDSLGVDEEQINTENFPGY